MNNNAHLIVQFLHGLRVLAHPPLVALTLLFWGTLKNEGRVCAGVCASAGLCLCPLNRGSVVCVQVFALKKVAGDTYNF